MQWVRIAKCLFPGQLLKRCDGTFGYTSFPYKCPNIMWASLGHLKLPLVFCRDRKQLVAIMGLLVPTMIQLMMMTESPRIAIHLCLVFYHVDSVKEHERRPYIMFFFNLPGQLGGVIRGCWRMAHGWGLLAKFCFLKPLICMKRILYVQINANIYIYIYLHTCTWSMLTNTSFCWETLLLPMALSSMSRTRGLQWTMHCRSELLGPCVHWG